MFNYKIGNTRSNIAKIKPKIELNYYINKNE